VVEKGERKRRKEKGKGCNFLESCNRNRNRNVTVTVTVTALDPFFPKSKKLLSTESLFVFSRKCQTLTFLLFLFSSS
jgi:hypothetical protein